MNRPRIAVALIVALAIARPLVAGAAPDASDFAFRPHPDAQLPLDAALVDEGGRPVTLARYFNGLPVVLVLEYLRCKTFCGLTLSSLMVGLDALPLDAGLDYQIVAISIDPRDSPADNATAKAKYAALYHHPGDVAGMHFLGGAEPQVRRVADAIGFPYRYDPQTDQYVHPVGFVLATPGGKVSQYIFAVDPPPSELRAAITDAAQQRAISPLERFVLLCHVEGVPIGRFTIPILAAFMLADIVAGAGVAALFISLRRRRHG
jgi:protein SCO1/2